MGPPYTETMTEPPRRTRAQQRHDTEARILDTARETFAELGYERTTIRAVAASAGVNPGLVMHYFGSKEELFARAAHLPPDELAPGDPAEALLATLRQRLEGQPVASLAVLRSMLTHDEAADGFREAGRGWLSSIERAIPAGNAELRAALIGAIITGVVVDRYLLKIGSLTDAPADDVLDLLRPCIESLAGTR
jgi:AcrR family transcriptional regulator